MPSFEMAFLCPFLFSSVNKPEGICNSHVKAWASDDTEERKSSVETYVRQHRSIGPGMLTALELSYSIRVEII